MEFRKRLLVAAGAAALVTAMQLPAFAEDVTQEMLDNGAKSTDSVLMNGFGPKDQRFSPLKIINKDNIKGLIPAWSFSFGGEKQRGQESQALIKDGVIYVTGSYSRAYAINAHTGEKIWEYDARLPEGILPCCDVVNRGGILWKNKFIFGTLDAKLVALDAKSGKVVWKKTIDDFKAGYSYTAAPMIVKGKLITGLSGGEFGVVGKVQARDPDTGEEIWSRPVIEGNVGTLNGKESTMTGKANETWPGDTYKFGSGATWLGGTYDPELNLLYIGTGNPGPWNSWLRPGDNKWSASRLALNPDNGEIVWGYQTTPHDGWDYDGVNEFVPFDATVNGKTMKLGGTADRNGFFYVLDRTNGKFITAHPFVEKINWAKGIDKDGRPEFIDENRPGDPTNAQKGKTVHATPGFLGGKNWMPVSYDPQTKLFYVPSNEWGMDIWNEPVTYKKGAAYLGAGFTIVPTFQDHIGALKAMDPLSGKIVWQVNNKAPLWGGVLSTAGGLVFYGTPEGYLKALDAKTGNEVWKFQVGTGVVSSPITWTQDGEQWVGVAAGWGGAVPLWGGEVAKSTAGINQGGSFWAFHLPKNLASR
jgi:alcohol dehydrogenase (cytochrome c)